MSHGVRVASENVSRVRGRWFRRRYVSVLACLTVSLVSCGEQSGSDGKGDRGSASAELCALESVVTTPQKGVNLRQVVVGNSRHRPGDSAIAGASAKGVPYEVAVACQPGMPYIDPNGQKSNQWHLVKLPLDEGAGTWFSDQWVSETEGTLLRNFAWVAAGMLDGCHCEGYANSVAQEANLIAREPSLVVDHLGRATLVWIESDGQLMAKRTDQEGNWSEPEVIQQLVASDEKNDEISRNGVYQRRADSIETFLYLLKRIEADDRKTIDQRRDQLLAALQQQEDYAAESGSTYVEDEEVLRLIEEVYDILDNTPPDANSTLSDKIVSWDDKAYTIIGERRQQDEENGIEQGFVTAALSRFEGAVYTLYYTTVDLEGELAEIAKLETFATDPTMVDEYTWNYSYEYGAPEAAVDADNNVIVIFRVSLFLNEQEEEFRPIRLKETLFAKKFNAEEGKWEATVPLSHYEGVDAVSHSIGDFGIDAKKSGEALAVYAVQDEMIDARNTGYYYSRWGDGLSWEQETQMRDRISIFMQSNVDVAIAEDMDRHAVACWGEIASTASMDPQEVDTPARIRIIDCVRHHGGVWEEMTSPYSTQDAARIRFEGVVPPPGRHVSNQVGPHANFGDKGDLVVSANGDAHIAWRVRTGGSFSTRDFVYAATCPVDRPTHCDVVRLTDATETVGLTQVELERDRGGRIIARWDAWPDSNWSNDPIYQQSLYDPERKQWTEVQNIEVIGDGTAKNNRSEDKFDLSEYGYAAAVWPRNTTVDGQRLFNQLVVQFFHGDDPWDSSTWSDVEALGPAAGDKIYQPTVEMDDQGRVIFVIWLRVDKDGNEIWETKRLVARADPLGQIQAPAKFKSTTLGAAPTLTKRLAVGNPLGLSLSQ